MTILFGHPTGNPNSHHAALAHLEAGQLEAFCVAWMPTPAELAVVSHLPFARRYAHRLSRRSFPALARAELVEGRTGEWMRMLRRMAAPGGDAGEGVSLQANDWLMRTMTRECARASVTAVHSYEECSLLEFREARRLDKRRIYDLPIGYGDAWLRVEQALLERYGDWLAGPPQPRDDARLQRKREELQLADRVLVPSTFVANTVREFVPDKPISVVPYGVDAEFWRPPVAAERRGPRRFVFAGQLGLRKGMPLLLQAWRAANLPDAELHLIGRWSLAESRRREMPANVVVHAPMSRTELREQLQNADVFVFPSFFEGFALVVLEAMACGLPVIASDSAGAGHDVLDDACGRVAPTGDLEALVTALREMAAIETSGMARIARARAQLHTWDRYRSGVNAACAGF